MYNELNVPEIYGDPILTRKRLGNALSPHRPMKEHVLVESNYALLTEIPTEFDRVQVFDHRGNRLYESQENLLNENTFYVDYVNGVVYFSSERNKQTLRFEYMGEGVYLIPDSRVYLTTDTRITARTKFKDIDRLIVEQKNRVETLIRENPQPSEVVDGRVDRNGKVYPVLKERIDAEQLEIEEARVDAFDKEYPSLKTRIDALQSQSGKTIDDIEDDMVEIWAEIELIPGKIRLEVGELREQHGTIIERLEASIELIPGQITAAVSHIQETLEGEIDELKSSLKLLPGEIELKVNHNDIISSINLSPENIQINSKKINLVGAVEVLSDITGELGTISTGTLDTVIINGKNKQIYFGNNDPDNFEGRIDYIEPFMRLQSDRQTYYAIRPSAMTGNIYQHAAIHNMFINGSSMFSFGYDPDEGFNHRVVSSGNVRLKFLNSSRIAIQARNLRDDSYAEMHASDFITGSMRHTKSNIRPYESNVLNTFKKDLPVRTYTRKSTEPTPLDERYHLGFIYDEVPNILRRGEGIDNLSVSAYLAKAIQELMDEVNVLRDEVKSLKAN